MMSGGNRPRPLAVPLYRQTDGVAKRASSATPSQKAQIGTEPPVLKVWVVTLGPLGVIFELSR